ncbi:MAG: c-type cytochrome [Chloroflexi bacterium]|nr:c-type cytochrome [Chloroflexota bacterium]
MKIKQAWYLGAVLILGIALLSVSCDLIEPPVPALPVATTIPPTIPHPLEGRADCRLCHEKGIGGAPQFPANHSERPSDVCQTCHRTASGVSGGNATLVMPAPAGGGASKVEAPPVGTPPAAVSAKDLFGTKCAACHGANREGIPGFAPALTQDSLAKLSDSETKDVISNGRPGTAMPAFKGALSPEELDALLQLIKRSSP